MEFGAQLVTRKYHGERKKMTVGIKVWKELVPASIGLTDDLY